MNSPRRTTYQRGRRCRKEIISKSFPKKSHSARSPFFYNAEHTQFVPKTEKLSAAKKNWARKILKLRQPIKIDQYVTRVVSQSESRTTSPKSSRLGCKTLLGCGLQSARYSLSLNIRSSTPCLICSLFYSISAKLEKNRTSCAVQSTSVDSITL